MRFVAGVKEAAPAHHHRSRPQRIRNVLNITPTETIVNVSERRRTLSTVERDRMAKWLQDHIEAGKKNRLALVLTITPVLAALLLDRNTSNRPISQRNATDLAADIANRRFEFNGESIVVSDTGVLIDGQHRLQQVLATGMPIETVIVFGVKEAARFTIDTGRSKTVANFLAMKGKGYATALGAAVGYFLQWKQFNRIEIHGTSLNRPTKNQVVTAADELPGMATSIEFTANATKTIRSHAIVGFCHYVFWKRSTREAADFFIQKLIEGDNLNRGDPIFQCRKQLLNMGRGVSANDRIELIFRAWNFHRQGVHTDRIRLTGRTLPKVER